MRSDTEYQRANGEVVQLLCEWCGAMATEVITFAPGKRVGHCDDCGDRAHRFRASLDPKLSQGSIMHDSGWLPSEDHPDLVILRPGKDPITIRDHRQLKAKALKELLPPFKGSKKVKSAPARAKDIARRRRDLQRDLRELLANREGMAVSQIAEVVGVEAKQLEELAA